MIENKPRKEQRPEDLWDLTSLYETEAKFEEQLNFFLDKSSDQRWSGILKFKGKLNLDIKNVRDILDLDTKQNEESELLRLGRNSSLKTDQDLNKEQLDSKKKFLVQIQNTREILDLSANLERELSKLYTYSFLKHDEDLSVDLYKEYFQKVNFLYQDFFQSTSWVEPEILAVDSLVFYSFFHQELLKEYHFYFKTLLHKKDFTLSQENEKLLSLSQVPLSSPQKAFNLFNNVDLPLGKVQDSEGNEYDLSHGSYRLFQRSEDRTLRKNAFLGLHQSFMKFENTLSELLTGHVQQHIFNMKARGYNSCLMAALYQKNIPTKTYHNLINTVRNNIETLHDYTRVRKECLGLDEIHLYDLQVPLCSKASKEIPYTQAVEWVIESVAPLGEEYQNYLAKGLTEQGWVDIYENQHKRSGAYSSGCYDSHPYMLLNYKGTLNDVFTLAHEAGHSMHTLYSQKNQPYIYARYPIFVAEVASIFNETLLMDYLLKKQDLEEDQLNLLHERIEEMRGTLFRQTLFAEFELHLHQSLEAGQPLTASVINEYYYQLNRDYYGPDLTLDKEASIEWARVPHFYSNFYVYQYATGISAALTLAYRVLDGEKGSKESYLNFLKAGGHKYPLDLLRIAGVNMESTEPIEKALSIFKELVNKLREVKSFSTPKKTIAENG